ncbi:MAG: 23S rRNA (adenine(2503)-C(2))-methyltransferase RlmN, partial [Lachnospiraceae bacterium]|nr:23S rRNA (adenine(2503)-C(2))-methyltransferase RlmN [Lachnospiraceae bacterium]
MVDIKSLTKEELEEEFLKKELKRFRAGQVYDWMHVKLVRSFDEMTNISKDLRERLASEYEFTSLRVERAQESALDGTIKFLFELADKNYVESVFMRYRHGNSVCISSQVGCRMGCRFCASTIDGCE